MARMRGTAGVDRLIGTDERDYLLGLGGNDVLDGLGGDDQLEGGDGDDTLNGGLGDDVLLGGDGDDDVQDVDGSDAIALGAGNDRLFIARGAGVGIETVSINGGDGDDTVNYGNERRGTTTIDLGAGNDRLFLYGASNGAQVTTGDGADEVAFYWDYDASGPPVIITDFSAGDGGDSLDITRHHLGYAAPRWRGNRNPFGADGFLHVVQEGDDTLFQIDRDGARGRGGFETVVVLKRTDVSALTAANLGGFAPDGSEAEGLRITGTFYHLNGTTAGDRLRGEERDDRIWGNAGKDRLWGGGGDDQLGGGAGNDRLYGEAGNDYLLDNGGSNLLDGGAGNDYIFHVDVTGGAGGGSGNATLIGGDGNDIVRYLNVRSGAAVVDLGSGDDLLEMYGIQDGGADVTTGTGTDTIALLWSGPDIYGGVVDVTDFAAGIDGDRLALRSFPSGARSGWEGRDPFAAGYLRLSAADGATLIEVDRDGPGGPGAFAALVRLHGVDADALVAFNFDGFDPRAAAAPQIVDLAATAIG